jgi:hypothetical protein
MKIGEGLGLFLSKIALPIPQIDACGFEHHELERMECNSRLTGDIDPCDDSSFADPYCHSYFLADVFVQPIIL